VAKRYAVAFNRFVAWFVLSTAPPTLWFDNLWSWPYIFSPPKKKYNTNVAKKSSRSKFPMRKIIRKSSCRPTHNWMSVHFI